MGILSRGAFRVFALAVIALVPEGIVLASAFSLKSETVPISY